MIAAPGIYPGLPDDEYRRIEAVSHSDLRAWVSGEDSKDSRRLFLRQAFHAALLQPDYAARAFTTMESDVDLRTTEGKAALAAWEERTGKRALQPKERESIKQMVISMRQDPEVKKILDAPGDCELAVISDLQDSNGKLLSKGLIDKKCRKCIIDLKGTGYWDEAEFVNQFYTYGYDSQGAYYTDLIHAHTGEYLPLFFVCCSQRSLQVWIQRLTPEQYCTGRRWYRDMLKLHSQHGTLKAQLEASVNAPQG